MEEGYCLGRELQPDGTVRTYAVPCVKKGFDLNAWTNHDSAQAVAAIQRRTYEAAARQADSLATARGRRCNRKTSELADRIRVAAFQCAGYVNIAREPMDYGPCVVADRDLPVLVALVRVQQDRPEGWKRSRDTLLVQVPAD